MPVTGIPELKESYRQLGPMKFTAMTAGTLGYIALWVWLEMTANWPGQCDHEGRKLWGLVKELGCSADLLAGGPREWGLFAMLWSLPAVVVGTIIYCQIKMRRETAE